MVTQEHTLDRLPQVLERKCQPVRVSMFPFRLGAFWRVLFASGEFDRRALLHHGMQRELVALVRIVGAEVRATAFLAGEGAARDQPSDEM